MFLNRGFVDDFRSNLTTTNKPIGVTSAISLADPKPEVRLYSCSCQVFVTVEILPFIFA